MEKKLFALALVFFALIIGIAQTAFTVKEPEQAMVLQFGKPVHLHTEPGLKFKVPFIQRVEFFDRRVLELDPPSEEVILSDQKRLVVDTLARYRIHDMLAFFTSLRTEEQAVSRLNNIISSSLRSTLGNATLSDVLSDKRGALMSKIRTDVNAAVTRFGIEIVDVRIGRADLPEQTSQAIYARMRTERQREAAEFRAQGQESAQDIRAGAEKERTILLAEAEKQSQILRGAGDQEAIRIYAEAFRKDPEFYAFYRTMEAYREGLAGKDTTFVIPPEGAFFRYFNSPAGK